MRNNKRGTIGILGRKSVCDIFSYNKSHFECLSKSGFTNIDFDFFLIYQKVTNSKLKERNKQPATG